MKKIWKEWKSVIILGTLIVAVALFLRIYNLTKLPVFADEAIYIRWAQVMRAEAGLRFLPLSDGKQPLFMWSMIPLFKLFNDPLFAGRFLSVVTGIVTLLGVFSLTLILFGSKKKALLASFIYAIIPFAVFFDRMALVDSMLSMFGIWTLIFGILTVKTLRLDFAMLTGFALGGALLTKSPALFFVLLLPSCWLMSSWVNGKKQVLGDLLKLFLLISVTYIIAYGMFNILRLGPNFQMLTMRNYDYVYPYSHILKEPFNPLTAHLKDISDWLMRLGPGVIIIMAAIGIYQAFKNYKLQLLLLSCWFLIPIIAQAEYAKVFTARYILFTIPYLTIFAANLWDFKKNILKIINYLVFAVFVIWSLYQNVLFATNPEKALLPRSERSGYLEEWTAGTGIKEVASYLREEQNINPQLEIVVGTEGSFGTLPDGLQIYLNDLPKIIVKGVGVPIKEVDKSLIESKKFGNKTYLLVNNTRLLIPDPKSKGLELIAIYPKAVQPDGFRETLLFFELK